MTGSFKFSTGSFTVPVATGPGPFGELNCGSALGNGTSSPGATPTSPVVEGGSSVATDAAEESCQREAGAALLGGGGIIAACLADFEEGLGDGRGEGLGDGFAESAAAGD